MTLIFIWSKTVASSRYEYVGLKKVPLWFELGLNFIDFWVWTWSEVRSHYWSESNNRSPELPFLIFIFLEKIFVQRKNMQITKNHLVSMTWESNCIPQKSCFDLKDFLIIVGSFRSHNWTCASLWNWCLGACLLSAVQECSTGLCEGYLWGEKGALTIYLKLFS